MAFGRTHRAVAVCAILFGAPVLAAANSLRSGIPAQPLPSALRAFAAQAHIQVLYVYSVVANLRSHAIRGGLDAREALQELLRGTGLEAVYTSDTAVTIRPAFRAAQPKPRSGTPGDDP